MSQEPMETINLLRNLWYVLIGVLFLGYSLLDGFDLGIGSTMPFLSKKEEEKRTLLRTIGPFWDGNEVWLLAGGGALFASFPHAYATVFSGFYLAIMMVLFALIFRAVATEFYTHDQKRKKFWEIAFITGSILPSFLYGVALGNIIIGVPLDRNMDFTGNFLTLLRPFPLIVGLLGLNAILLQGCTFAACKTAGNIQNRARKTAKRLRISFILLFLLSFFMAWLYIPGALKKIPAWIAAAVVLFGWFSLGKVIGKGKDGFSFFFSSLSFAGLWGIVGAIHFPNLVKASNDISLSLTIYNASSTELTLKIMLIIALIGLPLVIFYTIYVYKIFKGKVYPGEHY